MSQRSFQQNNLDVTVHYNSIICIFVTLKNSNRKIFNAVKEKYSKQLQRNIQCNDRGILDTVTENN